MMMIPKAPKHNRIRPGRHENKLHLAWVAKQPCCIFGGHPCDPHHPITTDSRREFGKANDWEVVPLCRKHHMELHDKIGDELNFQKIHSVNFHEAARLMVQESPYMKERD